MKKICSFAATLLLAVCAVVLSSCSKDNDSGESSKSSILAGKWKVTEKHDWNRTYPTTYTVHGDIYITFSSNGTLQREGTGYITGEYSSAQEEPLKGYTTWTYEDSSDKKHDGYLHFNATHEHGVDFTSASKIEIWGHSMYDYYYVLTKVN